MYSEAGFYAGGLIATIAFIWVAYEVWTKNYKLSTSGKVLWTAAAFFFSIITAIVYYFTEKRNEVTTA